MPGTPATHQQVSCPITQRAQKQQNCHFITYAFPTVKLALDVFEATYLFSASRCLAVPRLQLITIEALK
jgi:hypothetical protein